ncbi:MAG TPA: extracellular solute-binding protein [Candidatus Binatia bacterium]
MAASLEELAKPEGEVVFYSSLNSDQIKALTDGFSKKYLHIKVSFFRATGERIMQRILAEAQAGRHAVDVFTVAGIKIQPIKDRGLTAKFVPEASPFYADGVKDPEGHWTSLLLLLSAMGYNTKLTSPGEAPKKYEDLLSPKWKGKIGIHARDPEWFLNLQRRMGREKARAFLKSLSTQNPGVQQGHTLLVQLLTAGEYHLASNIYAHTLAREQAKGAPVQWIFEEPVVTYMVPIALAKNARHPNAGKVFINFALSREGQILLRDQEAIPAHKNVDAKAVSLKGLRLLPSDPHMAKDYEAALGEMQVLLGTK